MRPTTERVREAIFSILTSMNVIQGSRVVDLFAGSGALGIEALSRGAASAQFVENNPSSVRALKANLDELGLSATESHGDGVPRVEVVNRDVKRWIGTQQAFCGIPVTYDLAFCDPPYAFDNWEPIAKGLRARLLVAEADRPVLLGQGWEVLNVKRYGTTVVSLAKRLAAPEDLE